MKTLTATKAECERLRDADAKIANLPVPGRLVGHGPGTLGDGATTWYGWTRYRYAVEPSGTKHAYPVDETCETALASARAVTVLGSSEAVAVRAIVAKAVAAEPILEPVAEIPKGRP